MPHSVRWREGPVQPFASSRSSSESCAVSSSAPYTDSIIATDVPAILAVSNTVSPRASAFEMNVERGGELPRAILAGQGFGI